MSRFIAVAFVVAALTVAADTPAMGGPIEDSFFTVDPTSAPPGGTVAVDGICADDVNEWEAVFFYLDVPGDGGEGSFLDLGNFPITPAVAWSFELTIPPEATPGATTIAKQCARVDDAGDFDGGEGTQRLDFVVLEPTSVEPSTTATVPVSDAPPASEAETRPRFTG
jgi:hypothetical protein